MTIVWSVLALMALEGSFLPQMGANALDAIMKAPHQAIIAGVFTSIAFQGILSTLMTKAEMKK